MCHMKLDMMLTELGYKPTGSPPRLSVYLTNSLEEGEPANQTLPFAQWLSNEVKQANAIKRDMPIMCVIGNPPYAGNSTNKGPWITGLLDVYKKEPGGKVKLKERNPKWLNDDYVKFIRLSEYLIERNGQGVLGFITNHGYLDNPTFRGMRWHLLKTFDKLYVLDLHGNTKRKEVAPDGLADVNVFDIQQGVAILIGVRTEKTTKEDLTKKPLARVFHADLWGARASKYSRLSEGTLGTLDWNELVLVAPQYVLTPRDYDKQETYDEGFRLDELMPVNSNGIVTARDSLTIGIDKEKLLERVQDFASLPPEEARKKYRLKADVDDWTVASAQADLNASLPENKIVRISYRPFDIAWTYYTGISRGFHCRPRSDVMQHYLLGENVGLLVTKAVKDHTYGHAFVTRNISEAIFLSATTGSNAMNFPLYLYSGQKDLHQERQINFDLKIFAKLRKLANHPERGEPTELQVLDYVYGVLYCPDYRNEYSQFLKTGYPRIPWPETQDLFWNVSDKGSELRRLHLMEPLAVGNVSFPLRGTGQAKVEDIEYKDEQVWINSEQYFDNVPVTAWRTCIGSYQPARKWLKDHKGRTLSFDEIKHYQRILKVLAETDRIMNTIVLKTAEETEK
jgi:predicted helicase